MSSHTTATGLRSIHPFPARMAPALVLDELKSQPRMRVLDPMSGSGTTIAISKQCGHHAIGFDIDPLAVLLGRTWCAEVDPRKVRESAIYTLRTARDVARQLSADESYPAHVDAETRAFTKYWFDVRSRRQLAALARVILRRRDSAVRSVLQCALSRMIVAKNASVSLAIDIPHSRPRRVREWSEVLPFDRFCPAIESILTALPPKSNTAGKAEIQIGDARRLPLSDESIDFVITSPPYVNAIDYLRCSKFALVWLGHSIGSLRAIRAESVGTEVGLYDKNTEATDRVLLSMIEGHQLPSRQTGILRRYIVDMRRILAEVSRVLVRGGAATFVIGDSTIRGVFVRNSEVIKRLGDEQGLRLESVVSRDLPANLRYMPPPSARKGMFDSRMRTEVVIKLRKPRRLAN